MAVLYQELYLIEAVLEMGISLYKPYIELIYESTSILGT